MNCHFCTFADNTFYLHRIFFPITEADSFINITNSIALGFHCQDFIRNLLLHPDTVILYHKPYTIVFFPSPDSNFTSSVCFFFDSVMDRILNKGLQDQIQRLALQDFRLCFDFVIKIPVMQHALNFRPRFKAVR